MSNTLTYSILFTLVMLLISVFSIFYSIVILNRRMNKQNEDFYRLLVSLLNIFETLKDRVENVEDRVF